MRRLLKIACLLFAATPAAAQTMEIGDRSYEFTDGLASLYLDETLKCAGEGWLEFPGSEYGGDYSTQDLGDGYVYTSDVDVDYRWGVTVDLQTGEAAEYPDGISGQVTFAPIGEYGELYFIFGGFFYTFSPYMYPDGTVRVSSAGYDSANLMLCKVG